MPTHHCSSSRGEDYPLNRLCKDNLVFVVTLPAKAGATATLNQLFKVITAYTPFALQQIVVIYMEIIMPMNRKNMEDEIEGEFVPPPEKTLDESLEEARNLSEELRKMQSHLGEDLGFPFVPATPLVPKKRVK
jgi:hypothetical protein